MTCIDSIHVQAIVCFCVSKVFGFLKCSREIGTSLGHASQDVVGSAIDDPVKTEELIGNESFTKGFEDRDSACDAGFEIDWAA